MIARWLARAFTLLLVSSMLGCAAMGQTASITINGILIGGTEARPDITVNIVEVREGGSNLALLLPGLKRYGITVVSRDPIAVLESQLPVVAIPARFTIGMENGRTFHRCLVAGLTSEGTAGGYRLLYALRCEDVAP